MKFLRQLLLENKEEYIAQQMGPKIMDAFKADTGRKPQGVTHALPLVQYFSQQLGSNYIQWIVKQYVTGAFKCEDMPQLKLDLIHFTQLVKANAVEKRDINAYPTLNNLRQLIRDKSVAGEGYKGKYEKLYQGINQAVQQGLGKWLYNKPNDPVKIYIPTNEAGSVCIRKAYPDIKWCTTHEDDIEKLKQQFVDHELEERFSTWKSQREADEEDYGRSRFSHRKIDSGDAYDHLAEEIWDEVENGDHDQKIAEYKENMHDYYKKEFGGEYYVILTPDGPYQFHFESNQFKDEEDLDVPFKTLISKYPIIGKILEPIVTKLGHPHFVPAETNEAIKKALMVSLENMVNVKFKKLSPSDWGDIILYKLKATENAGPEDDTNVLYTVNNKMRYAGHISPQDRAASFEKVIKSFPKGHLSIEQIPREVLEVLNPEVGKEYLRKYHPTNIYFNR